MLLKTHGEKMSVYRPLAMLMKINELKLLSGDVDEKKGIYRAVTSDKWLVTSNGSSTKVERQAERDPSRSLS